MEDQKLRDILEELHAEIMKTESIDEEGKILLRSLSNDINELLQRNGAGHLETRPSMLENMERGVEYFEASHPTLTATLSELLSILSNAGI